ncbi:MAG: DUF1772 domain-containing protein [Bryobacteraceae bacterium]
MKLKLAQFSTNILFALVMGVFWGTWFALSRSIAALSGQTFLDIGHTIIRNLGVPMSILMPLSLVSAIVVLVLLPMRSIAFALALAGFLLMIIALIVTLGVEVPIDRQIEQWTVATLPSDWRELRDRWEFYHAMRTFVSIGALGLTTASSLFDKP